MLAEVVAKWDASGDGDPETTDALCEAMAEARDMVASWPRTSQARCSHPEWLERSPPECAHCGYVDRSGDVYTTHRCSAGCNDGWRPVGDLPCPQCNADGTRAPNMSDPKGGT